MLRFILIFFSAFYIFQIGYAQSNDAPNGWKAFAKVKFEPTMMEDDQYLLVPEFTDKIKALEGKQIKLKGFVMPFDYGEEKLIILSKYPYSSCFFCGAAGPESVAEVYFPEKFEFDPDEIITIVGTLRLNDDNIEMMNFIIENSKLIVE